MRDLVLQTSDQIITQFNLPLGLTVHDTHGTLYGCPQSHDAGDVLCTGSAASLLRSAVYKRTDLYAFTDIQKADALGAV